MNETLPKPIVARLRKAILAGTLLCVQLTATAGTARPFLHPERIRYDGQCLTINGRDTFIFSGTFHYFRCPKELWLQRFAKIKAAGFNCVDTYIPWNLGEPAEPKNLDDFSQVRLRDFEDWLRMAETNGLYVIARPGPFICAEWERGGFPGWLINKRPTDYRNRFWFRSNDPTYVAWARHWYRAVLPILAQHQVTRRPAGQAGVILVFVENEYDHYFKNKEAGAEAIKNLAAEALAEGIDVPLATCETDLVNGNSDPVLRHVFNVRNEYPGWNVSGMAAHFDDQRRRQPDAPLMIAEAQGGWFSFDWDTPPLYPDRDFYRADQSPAQINNLTLFALQHGVTLLNYYMLVGGTNPGNLAAKDMATSYDFNAPIRECGGVGEKYLRVAAIGRMIREYGPELVRSRAVDATVTTEQRDVTVVVRQSMDGARFLFVRTDQHESPCAGTAHVRVNGDGREIIFKYQLEPFGSKVLFLPSSAQDAAQGKWLPEAVPPVVRPDDVPLPVVIKEVAYQEVPTPEVWKALPDRASLNTAGIFDNRFVCYRANFVLKNRDLASPWRARITYPTLTAGSRRPGKGTGDHVLVSVNGGPALEADAMGDVVLPTLREGKNEMVLLYENIGCLKEGDWMEKQAGIRNVRLLPALPADRTIAEWKLKEISAPAAGARLLELARQYDDRDWRALQIERPESAQLTNGQAAIFRSQLVLSSADIRSGHTGLFVSQISDYGRVFVNGRPVGESRSKIVSHTFDMTGAAQAGTNVVAILVSCDDILGRGGIGVAKLTWPETAGIRPEGLLQYADPLGGEPAKSVLAAGGWQAHTIPDIQNSSRALLSWHRLTFQLPAVPKAEWVPWLIRLHVRGDGFIYLNGHDIGRYQEAGAQRDFYLPECWLNAGTTNQNEVTLCLRPGPQGAAIESAEVLPYSVYAEKR